MTSPAVSWRISKIANDARKTIESLDLEKQERILIKLESLQADPFLGDVKKVKGKKNIFRLRVEDSRIYFRLNISIRSIEILLFDHRGQIKDKSIERL
ncbi:MAG: hypothetical protein E4H35_07335 [Candidatus Aminicenantes bacterium]|nr:MAG: hypothetical protein E4H35_07335 [Candidatus Aminicenantes bacterium]